MLKFALFKLMLLFMQRNLKFEYRNSAMFSRIIHNQIKRLSDSNRRTYFASLRRIMFSPRIYLI